MAAASLFVEISKEFLDNLIDNSIPENTKTATKYGMKIFNGNFVVVVFFLNKATNLFYKFETNRALLSSISLFNILSFFIIEWPSRATVNSPFGFSSWAIDSQPFLTVKY